MRGERPVNFAILASGSGSNAEALVRHFKDSPAIRFRCLLANNPDAFVLKRMGQFEIDCHVVPNRSKREDHEKEMLAILNSYDIEWVCLAGYMRLLTSVFLQYFWDDKIQRYKILNIHPSKLPLFPGINAYERAFESDCKDSAITVHFVDRGVDTGPVVLQESFEKLCGDGVEDFKKRGLELEHKLYSRAVEKVVKEYAWV